jgi:hypothetical protein
MSDMIRTFFPSILYIQKNFFKIIDIIFVVKTYTTSIPFGIKWELAIDRLFPGSSSTQKRILSDWVRGKGIYSN